MNDDHVAKTIAVYDQIAADYARKIDLYLPSPELEKFISLLPKEAKILDAGCGPGRDCDYFIQHGLRVVGVDLSEKLLDLACQRVPKATFQKQDLRTFHFPRESFNGIWANASLHHLDRKDVRDVLKTFFTILKRQGILYILVKKGTGEEDVVESISSGLPRHYIYYSETEVKDMIKMAGFTIVDFYAYREDRRRSGGSDLVWIASFSKKP